MSLFTANVSLTTNICLQHDTFNGKNKLQYHAVEAC